MSNDERDWYHKRLDVIKLNVDLQAPIGHSLVYIQRIFLKQLQSWGQKAKIGQHLAAHRHNDLKLLTLPDLSSKSIAKLFRVVIGVCQVYEQSTMWPSRDIAIFVVPFVQKWLDAKVVSQQVLCPTATICTKQNVSALWSCYVRNLTPMSVRLSPITSIPKSSCSGNVREVYVSFVKSAVNRVEPFGPWLTSKKNLSRNILL